MPDLRVVALALVTTACAGDVTAVCIQPPCAVPVAVNVTTSSLVAGATIAGAFVRRTTDGASYSYNQTPDVTCVVVGTPATHELDIGAIGFQTGHRSVTVLGTQPACGCVLINEQRLSVELVPTA